MKSSGTTRAIGYVRVSTGQQAEDGVSMEAQAARIAQYCDLHCLELVGVESDGLSGKRADNRPGLAAALDRLRAGEGVALVVYSLSRLSRSVADFAQLVATLESSGVGLHVIDEKIDTGNAAGRLLANILVSLAQWEAEVIAERTKGALAHKIATSRRAGGVPYGWALAADGDTLEPIADEQAAIRLMVELRAGGKSYRAIGRALAEQGIQSQSGGRWHPDTIRGVLARAERLGMAS